MRAVGACACVMAAQPAATSATAQAEAKQVRDEWLETDLGKLETWDRRHRVDLQAFEDNPDDPGEVWYGEEAHEKTLEFILDLVERSQAEDWPGARLDRKTSRLGDFGCGNALMTVDVVKQGWVHCVGLDYSSEGIDLAAAVLRQAAADLDGSGGGSDDGEDASAAASKAGTMCRSSGCSSGAGQGDGGAGGAGSGAGGAAGTGGGGGEAATGAGNAEPDCSKKLGAKDGLWYPVPGSGSFGQVQLIQADLHAKPLPAGYFSLIVEKGLLDAMMLNPEALPISAYVDAIVRMLVPGGLFVITSGNWTVDELVAEFAPRLEYVDHVRTYRVISFGGREGSTSATVAFRAIKEGEGGTGAGDAVV